MAVPYNPFRFVMPFQHITNVAVIKIIWRAPRVLELALAAGRARPWNIRHGVTPAMIEYFGDAIDSALPGTTENRIIMRNELKVCAMEMVSDAMAWLSYLKEFDFEDLETDYDSRHIMAHLIHLITWNQMGCVDGARILRAYVRNRYRVSINVWRLLCDYCLEDEIIKFAERIDFDCPVDSGYKPVYIYWYWKVFGAFPSEEILAGPGKPYDRDSLLRDILRSSLTGYKANTSAVLFFRRELNDEAAFMEICLENQSSDASGPLFYFLRGIEDEKWLGSNHVTNCIYRLCIAWPFMLFTDDWMLLLEDRQIVKDHFYHVLSKTIGHVEKWTPVIWHDKPEPIVWDTVLYGPFAEHLRLFIRRGLLTDREDWLTMHTAFFENKEATLIEILFDEGSVISRSDLLRHLISSDTRIFESLRCWEFCGHMEEMLESDEERRLFQQLVNTKAY